MWNGDNQKRKADGGGRKGRKASSLSLLAPRSSRRGVLLLVVLSMLVLFMLIGTAFLMTSSQSNVSAKASAKKDRLGNLATRLLDRAALQVIRDTENPHSAIRYHSLLRDLYGADGFQAATYSPQDRDFNPDFPTPISQTSRFAGASNTNGPLGQTQGQFVDIYLGQLSFTAGDTLDLRHVLKLERNVLAQPQIHALPLTRGYYNGCLLTISSGAAAGQSTRVLDFEFIGEFNTTNPDRPMRIFRFRVMGFPRSDGLPLQINLARQPEIADLAGATFIVNGRPFNGTGVGYNPLAATGAPRLNALQRMTDGTNFVGAEVALTPNSRYLDFAAIVMRNADPFIPGLTPANFLALNDPTVPLANRPLLWKYQSFAGPGDADESYDAADFQNMFLALQTVTPRARGRVVHNASNGPESFEVDDPEVVDNGGDFTNTDEFLRLDLEDLPWPSFHRPDLVNFWYHRILTFLVASGVQPEDAAPAILHPYGPDALRDTLDDPQAVDLPVRDLIVGIKRKIMLRPIREDHPHFDGSNPQSVPPNLNDDSDPLATASNILIPYWEAVGPWDVDNDNDGINDSIWVDIGDPIIEAEDGTRYKALYSYLIIDLDSRLNVNAHGLADHINPPDLAYVQDPTAGIMPGFNLAGQFTSKILAKGLGYGPAEISLRPVFPLPWADINGTADFNANRLEDTNRDGDQDLPPNDLPIDSYATLMIGRNKLDATGISGKYGYQPPAIIPPLVGVTPGQNYMFQADSTTPTGEIALPDLHARLKFFDYPWTAVHPSAFGTPPDLKGRYALGVDYTGQPVYEVAYDPNPADTSLRHNLLANSPYEIDLSSAQRRDTLSDIQAQFTTSSAKFFGTMDANDDAAFATTDLERILRANDADTGMLPSRLWNVVDAFDPIKLMQFDPYRVTAVANAAFGSSNEPERLAAAQQIAAINRHLVTTDSSDLPVPGASVPNPDVYAVGPDGQPGRSGSLTSSNNGDDDTDGTIDEPDELNATISDDFRSLFGKEAAQATMFDLLRYRVWLEARREVMQLNGWDEAALEGLNAADYRDDLLVPVSARAEARLNGEAFVDANGNGVLDGTETYTDSNDNDVYDPPMAQLIAPELIAGKRMDLNRPFGDGRDSPHPITGVTDGVVDDPLEAGEPFLDRNGNGKCDSGEPFIDLDGSNNYTPPSDKLWADLTLQGILAEPIEFDYTNGRGEQLHPAVAASLPGTPRGALVRNLDSQARQLYARHLYCLMLLLVDENYIAPYDDLDPQIATYLDMTIEKSMAKNIRDALAATGHPAPNEEARRIMLRKLTCRMIAQWAVNCVDMRDADAIMTSFEYDEYPWDGWGTLDRNGILIPLDGDPATNENGNEKLPEIPPPTEVEKLSTHNMADVIQWNTGGAKTISNTLVTGPRTSLNQTRGLVWGAERPELLITETLAIHDRRTEDEASLDSNPKAHDVLNPTQTGSQPDPDLDQGLRPRGSLFVEIYNPWSPDGQLPTELYSKVDSLNPTQLQPSQGVELGRLSNSAASLDTATPANTKLTLAVSGGNVKRSPVWRLVVVEEWPEARNVDPFDDQEQVAGKPRREDVMPLTVPPIYEAVRKRMRPTATTVWRATPDDPLPPFRPTNPDFNDVFDANFKPTQASAQKENLFKVQYPYIEREFYFTTDNSTTRDVANSAFRLRIPNRSIPFPKKPGWFQPGQTAPPGQTQKFVPAMIAADPSPNDDVRIAPILPGRYGIVGSAGTRYTGKGKDLQDRPRFVTTIGRRFFSGQQVNTNDSQHLDNLERTRRIELRPPQLVPPDPNVPQFLVANNGGDPQNNPIDAAIGRDNELIDNASPSAQNITDLNNDGVPDADVYQQCVAIPVEGMNVSEPPWGYGPREWEVAEEEGQRRGDQQAHYNAFNPTQANGEGRYASTPTSNLIQYYDVPLDANRRELMRNGTTANYRTIHLQRLANPLLPWNPPPKLADGSLNPEHHPNLPVNPYRTVDSSSVDLTTFNGVSSAESNYKTDPTMQFRLGQLRPWVSNTERTQYQQQMLVTQPSFSSQVWHFRSVERGYWARLNPAASAGAPQPSLRALWAQEPAHIELRQVNATTSMPTTKILDGRDLTTMGVAPPSPANNRVPDDIKMPKPDGQDIIENRVNMVMEHSLGFGNESFGKLYGRQGGVPAGDVAPTATSIGAPRRYMFDTNIGGSSVTIDVASTYPWLALNNRPLVSVQEILQVPAASSAQMLRQYSTINSNLPSNEQPNPYDGDGWIDPAGGPVLANLEDENVKPRLSRLGHFMAPFGQLLNPFLVASFPAQVAVDNSNAPITDPTDPPLDPANPLSKTWKFIGAPHFYRILECVQVPSRYVGTETRLNAETFNDDLTKASTAQDPHEDITGSNDPRYNFQPPFNQVSRERDPGRVNLNTVTGRRIIDSNGLPRIWSEVYDGIMHRSQILDPNPTPHFIAGDGNLVDSSGNLLQLGHSGPAWRDVALSRRGYVQIDAAGGSVDKPVNPGPPDAFQFGLNNNFPTIFANPFRSPDAGLLVPLVQMQQYGVDAALLRGHPRTRGLVIDASGNPIRDPKWGDATAPLFGDARDAGFGNDEISYRNNDNAIPSDDFKTLGKRDTLPLFSEVRSDAFSDTDRNPYMMYQPMSRLGNLVTNRSNVFAVWITVGYFEVEKAPPWDDTPEGMATKARFGGDIALYNRVYPDGYMLAREVGSDTGDVKRARGFYILDRTEEVGFKPGDDLNVERMIRLRRRIE